MELKITSVKIDKKGIPEIGYVEKREDGKSPHITHEGTGVAHDDFLNAVRELAPHYALITGYASFNKGLKLDTLKAGVDNFKISGYSIGGKEGDEGITITGHVIVPWSGKAAILNSPFQLFDEEQSSKTYYKFIDPLVIAVENIAEEARLYIGGKFKPELAQSQLPFEDGQEGGKAASEENTGEETSGTVVSEGGELHEIQE